MNYLAHLHLGGDQPAQLLGSLYGDFVKGWLKGQWPADIEAAIRLHRRVDVFTDAHEVVMQARARFPVERRRYSGILLDLLASEILAVTGQSPSERFAELAQRYGTSAYARIDAPADREQKAVLAALTPGQVAARELAGEEITAVLTRAPGNDAPIGGLTVTTASAWFAARPSGTEDVYKIYAESFLGEDHLHQVQQEAQAVVDAALVGG